MIARAGYSSQTYIVETEDGFLLNMNRIFPKGSAKRHPVLLQHGLVSSAADWLVLGPQKSIGNAHKIKKNIVFNFFTF
jgi:lysosomal acid lipase/cholesteryl ester hydrolase